MEDIGQTICEYPSSAVVDRVELPISSARLNLLLTAVSPRTVPPGPQCFSIHVRLNGTRIDGPQVTSLKTNQNESTASLNEGCFKVPPALLMEKALDVSFRVPGNKVYLSGRATEFFAGPWDIDLADRKFGSEVSLPKHARAREACAVVFHLGDPETALVQTGCRTPLRPAR